MTRIDNLSFTLRCIRRHGASACLLASVIAPAALAQPTTAIGVTLPPAPSVSSYSPQGKVIAGMNITIAGSGFDPTVMEVRLGGHKLVLISRSTTRLVARAPRPEETIWQIADFRAGLPLSVQTNFSQARVLHTAYKVLDRWQDFQPRLVSMVVSQVAGGSNDGVLRSVGFLGTMTLAGMPGNVFDSLKTGPIAGSDCGQVVARTSLPASKTYVASPDGGTFGLVVRFHFDPVRLGPCELTLPMALHYADTPSDVRIVRVNLGTHAVPNPVNILTVSNTTDLTNGGFLKFTDPTGSAAWGICSGSAFPGGPAVGRLNIGGDVAFKILTGPVGTTCPWTFEPPLLRDGYSLTYVFSDTETGSKCGVSQSGTPQDGRLSSFTFSRLTKFTGWETDTHSSLFGNGDRVQVFLTCASDINPGAHTVVSRLERVEIRAPSGVSDWRSAFR